MVTGNNKHNPQHTRRQHPINLEGVRGKMSLTNILTIVAMVGGLFGVYSNAQSEIKGLEIEVQNIKDTQAATKGDIIKSLDKLENKVDLLLADRRSIMGIVPQSVITESRTTTSRKEDR